MDFASVYLIKELHHDKGVEDDGVVLRWRRVEGSITSAVNVKDLLTYKREKKDHQCDVFIFGAETHCITV